MEVKEIEIRTIDPVGIVLDKYILNYDGSNGNRLIITINGHHHMFHIDGKYSYEIGVEPDNTCECSNKPMKPQSNFWTLTIDIFRNIKRKIKNG